MIWRALIKGDLAKINQRKTVVAKLFAVRCSFINYFLMY